MNVLEQCENAKEAFLKLSNVDKEVKKFALFELASDIEGNAAKIIAANKKDISKSKGKIPSSLLKRLTVDKEKVKDMATMVRSVANLDDPVGKVLEKTELSKGLILKKITVPIGVICCIFESRPEVVVQISALAIKSGNAVLLKGGKEASNTNKVLADIIRKSIKDNKGISADAVQLIETREQINEVLKMDEFIDMIIPRGSNSLVKYIQQNTRIAVLGHADGICHVYVDKNANLKKAVSIAFDAKCQYAAVCNAMETLLVNKSIANKFLPLIVQKYIENSVEVRLDNKSLSIIKKSILLNPKDSKGLENSKNFQNKNKSILKKIRKATEKDWRTEYNDLIVSVKVVNNLDEAIKHINNYGSGHTDSIITDNKKSADKFLAFVDSSSVMLNCSTRFSDGYRYGFGAEVGISTNKVHARGPVGIDGLSTYKYVVIGNGHIVDEFEKGGKRFTHKKIK
ncbi:MAG: glutamate-5-semialdehyde dehydrogenase [Nanoarchaeota archaeon]|nr:glutamate-5-semialdehyde dehydrogenase [Nanoarchaeota archaeon]